MKKIGCFIQSLDPWGLFIGMQLAKEKNKNLQTYKTSVEFYNLVTKNLEEFFDIYKVYTKDNLEKYFGRYVN